MDNIYNTDDKRNHPCILIIQKYAKSQTLLFSHNHILSKLFNNNIIYLNIKYNTH